MVMTCDKNMPHLNLIYGLYLDLINGDKKCNN